MSYVAGDCSTYSKKEFIHLPNYPKQIKDAYGCWVVDENGYDYIDFTCSLGAISLGYSTYGGSLSLVPLPHASEEETAQQLCEITGWEQVRWCKNGSDATEAAVRLARFVTGRKTIICNSYHGSHADLVNATPGKDGGVLPDEFGWLVRANTPDELMSAISLKPAAVIMEPVTWDCTNWQLEKLRAKCLKHGVLLIFDEVITGWRGKPGSCVDVKPDLACYGKAIGNGASIACVAGSRYLMKEFEHRVFMSGTYAASIDALEKTGKALKLLTPLHFETMKTYCKFLQGALDGIATGYPGRIHINLPLATHQAFVEGLAKRGVLVGRDFFFMHNHDASNIAMAEKYVKEVRDELNLS